MTGLAVPGTSVPGLSIRPVFCRLSSELLSSDLYGYGRSDSGTYFTSVLAGVVAVSPQPMVEIPSAATIARVQIFFILKNLYTSTCSGVLTGIRSTDRAK